MESPVVLDKPPEYHGKDDRGFPFEEEESAWSDLAARHPDIAARLRQRAPANWARKRRPSSQDADEFGESFSNFGGFPFDDIPAEFREHFPARFNHRFGREEAPPPAPHTPPQAPQTPPHQQTIATQTELDPPSQPQPLPQYGLRNTVDLGQKSAADPSLVDADERNQRSLSAPPESRTHVPKMSAQEPPAEKPQPQKVRQIPIFVEGRDQPVMNNDTGDGKPYHHPQPPLDNSYFQEDPAPYTQPAHFSKSFGGPYKNYGKSQPFTQKVYPQTSPRPQEEPHPRPQPQTHKPPQPQTHQPPPQPQPQAKPQQPPHQPPPQTQPQPQPPQPPSPPPASKPTPPDPITQILAIQTDVLNLMTEVEKFTGAKKDKRYVYLDEMLTRNLIKLDNIETDGKENIRNARKEAIKCIQKCIAVLEAKADSQSNAPPSENKDTGMSAEDQTKDEGKQNGEVEQPPVEGEPAPADTRPPTEVQDVDKKPKNTKKRDKSADKADGEKAEAMQVDQAGTTEPHQMEMEVAASQ